MDHGVSQSEAGRRRQDRQSASNRAPARDHAPAGNARGAHGGDLAVARHAAQGRSGTPTSTPIGTVKVSTGGRTSANR